MAKQGLEKVLDCVEALRVRIDAERSRDGVDYDQHLKLGHWYQLCLDALSECQALRVQGAYRPLQEMHALIRRLTALLALPIDTAASEIDAAMTLAIKRLQELEIKVGSFIETHKPPTRAAVERSGMPLVSYEEVKEKLGDDEPRPSWVLDQAEMMVLSGWLGDAAVKLERVYDHMRAHESRFNEDFFDELGRLSHKIYLWAAAVRCGGRIDL